MIKKILKSKMNKLYEQIVQRLGIDLSNMPLALKNASDEIISSYARDGLIEEREKILDAKANSKKLTEYREKTLPVKLNPFVFDWCVGLVLSDASFQYSEKKRDDGSFLSVRLKMQQVDYHKEFLNYTFLFLLPWVRTIIAFPLKKRAKVKKRKSLKKARRGFLRCRKPLWLIKPVVWMKRYRMKNRMFELDTLSAPAFRPLADLFQNPNIVPKKKSCVKKVIPSNIQDYLTPVAIAAWFCGDGGRKTYGLIEGKTIRFHTEGFSLSDCQTLADALKNRYGWNVEVVVRKRNNKYYNKLQITKDSFDSFCETVKPYILPSFYKRLPLYAPRLERNKFKKQRKLRKLAQMKTRKRANKPN